MASEYLKWKYRDVKPDEPIVYTKEEKRRNWWDYHKWHVVIAVVLVLIAADILWDALGIGQIKPDYQVAYVGEARLPEDVSTALSEGLASLGQDCNGDGQVTVQINQYITSGADGGEYAVASSVTLMGDLESCDSYFFLLEEPEYFQANYDILRRLDGTLPDRADRDMEGMWLPWTSCPVLTGLDLGDYSEKVLSETITGSCQEYLSSLSIARRGFWTEKTVQYPEACDALWEELTKGAS